MKDKILNEIATHRRLVETCMNSNIKCARETKDGRERASLIARAFEQSIALNVIDEIVVSIKLLK